MKQILKDNAHWVIIGMAVIVAVAIHACATRYAHMGQGLILDRWTGKAHFWSEKN